MPRFLVTGATGRQGGSLTHELLQRGTAVHALVRDAESAKAQALAAKGVVLFQGTFDDTATIERAMTEVDGLFLNTFPTQNPEDQIRQAQGLIDIAKSAKVRHIVVSTAFWTGRPEYWQKRPELVDYYTANSRIEAAVRESGIQYTILRPSVLMHNYLKPDSKWHFPELQSEAVIAHVFAPGRRMPHLDPADVGRIAAAAFQDPERFNKLELELGFENLTPEETATIITKVSGVKVGVRRRSEEEVKKRGQMLPAVPFQKMCNEEDVTIDGHALAALCGLALVSFEEFMESERAALLKSLPPSAR